MTDRLEQDLEFKLMAVSDAALEVLWQHSWADASMLLSPRLSRWLSTVSTEERSRRGTQRAESLTPLSSSDWSDAELAGGLALAVVVERTATDPEFEAFAMRLNDILVTEAACRLLGVRSDAVV